MAAYYNEVDSFCVEWLRNLIAEGLIAPGDVDDRSIVEVQPSDLKGYTQCNFFAGIGVWSHALRLAGWSDDEPVWTGSCPCFPSWTLIMTDGGFKPISDIVVGDMVLTHAGRFMPVTHTGSEMSECVTIKGQGHHGLTCTPDHPFYVFEDGHFGWRAARDMDGRRWATVCEVPLVAMPEVECLRNDFTYRRGSYRATGWRDGKTIYIGSFDSKDLATKAKKTALADGKIDVRGAGAIDLKSISFAYFLGYWLGDGWVSQESVFLCGSRNDCGLLDTIFRDAKLNGAAYNENTSSRIRCGSKVLSRWMTENFGATSHGKRIPVWLYGMPLTYRRAFLDGYFMADGHAEKFKNGEIHQSFSTASLQIAFGLRILLNQMGMSASIRMVKNSRSSLVIKGRAVNESPYYKIISFKRPRSFKFENNFGWGLVRSVDPAGIHKVYNLSVAEDESYTVDGIVVHNCQPFSQAGQRKGIKDERHLWPELYRLIRQCRPQCVFGEQVAGKDGELWLSGIQTDLESQNYSLGALSLVAAGCGEEAQGWVRYGDRTVVERVLVGAPHIRQRLYWVANSRCYGNERRLRHPETHGATGAPEGEAWQRERRGLESGRGVSVNGMADAEHSQRRAINEHRQEGCDGPNGGREETHGQLGARGEVCDIGGLGDTAIGGDGSLAGQPGSGAEASVADRGSGLSGGVEYATGRRANAAQQSRQRHGPERAGAAGGLAHADVPHQDGRPSGGQQPLHQQRDGCRAWSDFYIIPCLDGKARRAQLRIFKMAHRSPGGMGEMCAEGQDTQEEVVWPLALREDNRMGRLRGYGNAIVAPLAAEFIRAYMDCMPGVDSYDNLVELEDDWV